MTYRQEMGIRSRRHKLMTYRHEMGIRSRPHKLMMQLKILLSNRHPRYLPIPVASQARSVPWIEMHAEHAEKHVEHVEHAEHAEKHVEHAEHAEKQCWHTVADCRKEMRGFVVAVLASAVRMNDAPGVSFFPNEDWRTAELGSEHVADAVIRC